jgi:hypothetical protein
VHSKTNGFYDNHDNHDNVSNQVNDRYDPNRLDIDEASPDEDERNALKVLQQPNVRKGKGMCVLCM